MEPVKPLLKTEKLHLTAGQEELISKIYAEAISCDTEIQLTGFKFNIQFTPTQNWINRFLERGFKFYPSEAPEGRISYVIQYRVSQSAAPVTFTEVVEPWVPQNGEEVEASFPGPPRGDADYIRSKFIGADGEEWVVRALHTNDYTRVPQHWVRKPKKKQIPLAELLSVYASVKGLTQDCVELKPEN